MKTVQTVIKAIGDFKMVSHDLNDGVKHKVARGIVHKDHKV